MTSRYKNIFVVISIAATLVMFYMSILKPCYASSCNFKHVLHGNTRKYTATRFFDNGYECQFNRTSNQNRQPRRPLSLREYPCEQLPEELPSGVQCMPAVELQKYNCYKSTCKVKGSCLLIVVETIWSPFADGMFKCIFLNENVWISSKLSVKMVPYGPIKIFQHWFR